MQRDINWQIVEFGLCGRRKIWIPAAEFLSNFANSINAGYYSVLFFVGYI